MRTWGVVLLSFAVVAAAAIAMSTVGAAARSSALQARPWGHAAAASTLRAAAPAPQHAVRLLVLHTRSGQAKFFDNDHNNRDSVGDSFLFTETFVNAHGRPIGGNWISCVLHFGHNTFCEGTFRLFGKGSFDVSGTINAKNTLIGISSGTGAFTDAGGQVDTAADQGTKGKLFVQLRHLG
jgi:hypothetical protein